MKDRVLPFFKKRYFYLYITCFIVSIFTFIAGYSVSIIRQRASSASYNMLILLSIAHELDSTTSRNIEVHIYNEATILCLFYSKSYFYKKAILGEHITTQIEEALTRYAEFYSGDKPFYFPLLYDSSITEKNNTFKEINKSIEKGNTLINKYLKEKGLKGQSDQEG